MSEAKTPKPRKRTIIDIRRAHEAEGLYWFTPSSKRFFRSRIESQVYEGPGGIFFVSSSSNSTGAPRRYSIHQFDPATADISTVSIGPLSGFEQYGFLEDARNAAKLAAATPLCPDDGRRITIVDGRCKLRHAGCWPNCKKGGNCGEAPCELGGGAEEDCVEWEKETGERLCDAPGCPRGALTAPNGP